MEVPCYDDNPQEPPSLQHHTHHHACDPTGAKKPRRLPTCVFDLYLDLPHPAASNTDGARLVDPPVTVCELLAEEMCDPENIARISRLAFPEYDDMGDAATGAGVNKVLTSKGRTMGAHLTKHDVYHVDFACQHHTFSLVLSDGTTRVHGHVRRYLPPHADATARMDVGRRRPRAMILLTRAPGGERFYASVLKTAEAIAVEARANGRGGFAKKRDPVRSFLHALFNRHATLITQYAELRRHGLSLNFTQAPANGSATGVGKPPSGGTSACDTARAVMEEHEGLFRITLDKVEFGHIGKKKGPNNNGGGIQMEKDTVQFYLPPPLQPGYECLPPDPIPEDLLSPIIPLLRYIGPSHFVRLLSALLCERRIVLISQSIARLSTGVRAASSMLAQGLLLWKHILIPVLPPHMLKFLSVDAPYLVGILHPYASRLGKIEGLTDVLCVNLDTNEVKTLHMAHARSTVPDLLKKVRGTKAEGGPNAAECLARDLDEIVKADRALWEQEVGSSGDKAKESNISNKSLDLSETLRVDSALSTKQSILEKMRNPIKRHVTNAKRLEERKGGNEAVDAAVAFGRMIRSTFQKESEDEDGATEQDDDTEMPEAPKYSAPSHAIDIGSVEASLVAENEGGEEDVRAALTCFFIHMYGDMGMYLSETHGTFWLDRRKFLLRKKQLGERENSPAFAVLQKFSASNMFALHVRGRIDDMSMTARDRSNIMPHHIPLFDVCSKYLSVHRLDFSLINVRRIVSKTVLACTRHIAVERHIAIRTRALALTEDAPFDGNIALAIAALVDSCHECNTNLSVVMSVIWHRLNQTKSSMTILLALHLLKNLVSHGPLTAISEALDGAGKIYELKSFSEAKNADLNRDVRQAADHVYGLLVDLSDLFARRRRIAFSKAQQLAVASRNKSSWSDYLVRRLPLTIDGHQLHSLFRPEGMSGRVFDGDADGSVAPSVAASMTPSVMALSRLNQRLMETRLEQPAAVYDEDEEDRLFGPKDAQEEEDSGRTGRDSLAADLYSEQDQLSLPNTLENFNYAVSSSRGSFVSTAQSGSERSESPLPQAPTARAMTEASDNDRHRFLT